MERFYFLDKEPKSPTHPSAGAHTVSRERPLSPPEQCRISSNREQVMADRKQSI
jgi:hypothetical protein